MSSLTRIVRPLPKGQITIPVAMRRELGIDESSLLELTVEGDKIVISKLQPQPATPFRVYSDEEITEFLAEDRISPDTARRVRELMQAGLV